MSEEKEKRISCYECSHRPVCKHFDIHSTHFPFVDDSRIAPYLNSLAWTLANACNFYWPIEEQTK